MWPSAVLAGALVLGTLQAPALVSLATGGHGANIASATVSGTFSQYSPGELWGGGAPDEHCLSCTAKDLIGLDTAQSIKDGAQVEPATGDFTTSKTLFSVGTPSGSLDMSMTYDAQRSISEGLDPSAYPYSNPGPVGWGWQSSLNVSLYAYGSGAVQVNEDNGAEMAFTPLGNQSGQIPYNGCPVGDDQDYQKYTVTNSTTAFCAPTRVDAQMGTALSGEAYQFNEEGGKTDELFNGYGQLMYQGNPEDPYSIAYNYLGTPGHGTCPNDGESSCFTETEDGGGRTVNALINQFGLISAIFDPFGREYVFNYTDGLGNLNQVVDPIGNTTTYGYATSNGTGYNHEMTTITAPDGGQHVENITYGDPGMVTQTSDAFPNVDTYSYSDTNCGTLSGCTAGGTTQYTTVRYSDGEVDYDYYYGGLLNANCYGANTSCSGTSSLNWTFNYNFPSANGSDQWTTETVPMPASFSGEVTPSIVTDGAGQVVQYTDPNDNVSNFMYNDNGHNNFDDLCWSAAPGVSIPSNASCANSPPGATSYTYDSYANELSETDPLGNITRYGYYSNGLKCWTAPPTVTAGGSPCPNPGGSPSGAPTGATTDVYDSQGDVAQADVATGTSAAQVTTSSYDTDDELLWSIPPNGQGHGAFGQNSYETGASYYGNGEVRTKITPLDLQDTTYTYDADGNVLTASDPAGVTTTTYDPDDRKCWTYRGSSPESGSCTPASSGPAGSTSYLLYNGDSSAATLTSDQFNNATTYQYLDHSYPTKPTAVIDPMGTETSFAVYDDYGNSCVSGPGNPYPSPPACPTTPTSIAGDTTNLYNNEGQLVSTGDPDGKMTSYSYSGSSAGAFPLLPTSMTTPTGTTNYGYDLDGNQIWAQDPSGAYTSTGYDSDGRACWHAVGQNLGSTCSLAPQGTGDSTYGYDAAGNRTQMVDNNGNTSAPLAVTSTYGFDAGGNLLSSGSDNGTTVGYQYNAANEVTCIAYPVVLSGHTSTCSSGPSSTNAVVDRSYDGAGRLASTTDWLSSGNNLISYTNYNSLSQLGLITYPSSTTESLAYGYDQAANLRTAQYSGNVVGSAQDTWTPNTDEQVAGTSQLGFSSPTDTYNSYKRVATAWNPVQGGTTDNTYTYWNDGRIQTDWPGAQQQITYGYNAQLELTSVTNPNLPSGSADTSLAYTADGQRCWSHASSSLVSQPCSSPPTGATQYGWNSFGQLTSSGPTGATTSYSYDGNGLRMSESTGSSTSNFSWDVVDGGSTPLVIDDGKYAYIYGPILFGGTAPVAQINLSTSTAQYLSATPSGVQTVFSSSGSLQEEAAYSTYGTPVYEASTTDQSSFGFQGSYTDPSQLIYLINRYYDPATDQFLSVDPDLAETGQPYAFTGDDPLNSTDPLGLYNCGNKSSSKVVGRYRRRIAGISVPFFLRCGSRGKGGGGIRHIQEDAKSASMGGGHHFQGDLSEFAINHLVGPTIATGTPTGALRGTTIAYDKQFTVDSPALAPEPGGNVFTLRVVVNYRTHNVVTVYSPDDVVDNNPLDQSQWAGVDLTDGGSYPPAFYSPVPLH